MNLAKSVGADVPFLLTGGCKLATGRGDRLRAVGMPRRPWWVVLVSSRQGVSTAEAFAALRPADKARDLARGPSAELRGLGRAWAAGDWPQPTVNSFERGLFRRRPRLGVLVRGLREAGAATAHVGGSGPTVFGLFDSAGAARAAAEAVDAAPGETVRIVRPVGGSPRIVGPGA